LDTSRCVSAQRLSTVTTTFTLAVYAVIPPSLSRIRPWTVSVPVSVVGHDVLAVDPKAP
jgi:hypothetical protein